MKAAAWAQKNLLKLHKMFGLDFQGHDEEALELLKQIGACSQTKRMEQTTDI